MIQMEWGGDSLDDLANAIRTAYTAELMRRLQEVADWFGAQLAARAKRDRPWTDRTHAAREGLFDAIAADARTGVIDIYLSHGVDVDYGKHLELRWNGRYAVILPTVRELLPELRERLEGLMDE